MPSSPVIPAVASADFCTRAAPHTLPELMDGPCTDADLRACLRDLARLNRLTLAYRPTLAFLDRLVAQHHGPAPLHILDVGAGAGDTLRRIARWAARRQLPVRLTGIDLNPRCTAIARAASLNRSALPIEFLAGDALSFTPPAPVDVVLSSLVTHHMESPEITAFLGWMERTARLGWFVNDLRRSARSARWFSVLAGLLRWHRFVRHDGPVSFRRAFLPADWLELLTAAGLPARTAALQTWQPARLCVARLRPSPLPTPNR